MTRSSVWTEVSNENRPVWQQSKRRHYSCNQERPRRACVIGLRLTWPVAFLQVRAGVDKPKRNSHLQLLDSLKCSADGSCNESDNGHLKRRRGQQMSQIPYE